MDCVTLRLLMALRPLMADGGWIYSPGWRPGRLAEVPNASFSGLCAGSGTVLYIYCTGAVRRERIMLLPAHHHCCLTAATCRNA